MFGIQQIPDVNEIIQWMHSLPSWAIYIFLGISAFIENIFPPWPSDMLGVFSGFLSARGVISVFYTILSSVVGNLLGAIFMYYMGLLLEEHWEKLRYDGKYHPVLSRLTFLSEDNMQRAHDWIMHYGFVFVSISRFFAGIRFFVSVIAGMTRMHFTLYFIAFTIGATIWSILTVGGGYWLGDNWETLNTLLSLYNKIFFTVLLLGSSVFIVYKWIKAQKKTS